MKQHPARALYSTLKYWRSAGLKQLEVTPEGIGASESYSPQSAPDEKLNNEQLKCSLCTQCENLSQIRRNTVYGQGSLEAELMFIGSAPYEDDESMGLPFQGEVGQLMDRMIGKMGLIRDEVYMAPAIKCRTPDDRNPTQEEINNCTNFLEKQIEIVNPRIICSLGSVATNMLLKENFSISEVRGKMQKWHDIPVMPTFHPAYLLKKTSARSIVWKDMLSILEYLKS